MRLRWPHIVAIVLGVCVWVAVWYVAGALLWFLWLFGLVG